MRKMSRPGITAACILMVALGGCNLPGSPTAAPSTTGAPSISTTAPPAATSAAPVSTSAEAVSNVKVRIHLTTTSDWTNLRLVSGGSWVNPMNVSSSPEASAATIQGNLISLTQPLAQAEAGKQVEISLDVFFDRLVPTDQVVFNIQRGYIGSTQVELSTYSGGQARLFKTFTWSETNAANGNILEESILAAELLTPPVAASTTPTEAAAAGPAQPNDYLVIAQLNVWYHGSGCYGGFEVGSCSGQRATPLEPALGHTYDSADPVVLQQQINWAADYGVDAFSLEWTTPRGIGTSGSLEDNIDDAFLKAPNLGRIRWCIFYDTILRITQDPAVDADLSNGVNFDDPKVYNAFVSDFDHFSVKYFAQPQYLKIDGRPVIYIYAAWNFHGNYAGAIKEARAKARARGFDVFIVGDVQRASGFNSKLVSQFDGNTTFTFLIPDLRVGPDMGKTVPVIDSFWQSWRRNIQGLKVAGRNETVNFQPGWAPQFDNRLFDKSNPIYVPALSKDQVTAMAQVARDNAEPVGSLHQKLVWINTWNNWAETTTIEPTANQGPKYPAGNYQFDMLEVVRDVYGAVTFGSTPPAP